MERGCVTRWAQLRNRLEATGVPDEAYLFPLSYAQQRLWFLDRVAPGNPFYNIPIAIPISTVLDVRSLERALNAVVARHEALRTTFKVVDGEPSQVVHSALEIPVSVTNLTRLPPAQREHRTIELATEEARRPFDLESGPLVRCSVLTRGLLDYVLLLSMHHIISDGWSMGILATELTAFYQSFYFGYPCRLPDLPIQYPDFSAWQREWLTGETLESLLQYWRKQLDGLPVLDMPIDQPRPPVLTYRGAFHSVGLSPALSASVRRFASISGATPFMVLLAAFAAVLLRFSGQDRVAIGTAVANRNRAELEGLIGFFVNSLVLHTDLSADPAFREIVARIRELSLGAYAHQDLPFEKLVQEVNPPRDPSRNPLFQVTFQLVNTPTLPAAAETAEASAIQVQRGSAIFDIAFTLLDTPGAFRGIMEYSTDLFEAGTIERLDRHFQDLLDAALRSPEIPLSRLPLTAATEREELVRLSGGPALRLPDLPFVHHLFEAQAARTPEALAVQSATAQLRYSDLSSRARRLATLLRSLGVKRETRVGILMDRSAEMVTALLGTLAAGGAYVPLDTGYPADRLRFMVRDSGAHIILTESGHQEFARSLADDNAVLVPLDGDPILTSPELTEAVDLSPQNLAYILYTSGSSGQPKGVAIPHGALTNHMLWMQAEFPLQPRDRVLQRTPYSFDASVWEFFAPLMAGAALVVLPAKAQKDPELIVRCMADSAVTVVQFVPSLLRMVLEEPEFYACPSLRRIFCGGEALTDEIRSRIKNVLDVDVVNLYGPTEATIDATYYVCDQKNEPFGVPIGGPVSNTQAYVVDRHMEPVPIAVPGELCLAGMSLARGYIDQPAITAERFVPDPFSDKPGQRMYRTADRVRRLADGRLLFLGRMDEQVKIRGYRIELGEIESAIRQVDGVQNCAVVAETGGSEAFGLIGYLVAGDETEQAADAELAQFETERVSRWEDVYQEVYGRLSSDQPVASSFVGWNSSYTGLPIDRSEMAEWRSRTVARIQALGPKRVLEIGCGTGLLLTEIAPDCERYVGTDFSRPVLRYLQFELSRLPDAGGNVELLNRTADDFDGIDEGSFDTVILNSVVQYFPDIDYLVRVLQGAARTLAPGGSIFVGDVRSLPLLEAFKLSVALHRAGRSADAEDLLNSVQTAADEEQELVIDPRFFYELAKRTHSLSGAEISLKRSRYSNELIRFRYDVVLRSGPRRPPASCRRLNWKRDQLTIRQILTLTREDHCDALIIDGVPNARLASETALLVRLSQRGTNIRIDDLLRQSEDDACEAVHPEDFWEDPGLEDWNVRISFSEHPALDAFDVVLTKGGSCVPDPAESHAGDRSGVWSRYANNPLRGAITRRLASRIREKLSAQLPDYMMPSAFILLDELPLLPNGKLNRAAVPARRGIRHDDTGFIAPRTTLEQAITSIWGEVLDTDSVGIRDDFFTGLGGHSLLAIQLISRIREAFCLDVPLQLVFQAPTVEQFATGLLCRAPEEREAIETTASLLVRLGSMSEAELDAALQDRSLQAALRQHR
jgi:amino acid adenylation domain-containing protein